MDAESYAISLSRGCFARGLGSLSPFDAEYSINGYFEIHDFIGEGGGNGDGWSLGDYHESNDGNGWGNGMGAIYGDSWGDGEGSGY